ncbi:MAG: indolepyruvate ferredoxin oxidoreductase family protein, partial [Pseudomonadota bacterium]
DLPGMQIERRMKFKKEAVRAFARANPIDRAIYNIPAARYGIITSGKAHFDVLEALAMLGIDERRARAIGLDIYKVGIVWPLENDGAERFMAGKEEVLVIEEKRGIIESQLKEYLYDRAVSKPKLILGKHDETGAPLISWVEEMTPSGLAPIIAGRLKRVFPGLDFSDALARVEHALRHVEAPGGAKRIPYFCSGCPHNTSTKVPEGSKALAGIGCHFMASWMDRETSSLIQMGGEGVNWAAKSLFLKDRPHVFQNLGDGTYFHSGSMAIRQAIAAQANITYKILFNDAVAMTGGQPVDGVLTVPSIANQLAAEGVRMIVIVSDQPEKILAAGGYPPDVEVRHRDELDVVQRELREIKGVTALIYEQTCAAEKRRRRKKGEYPDPAKRIFINDLVCEGCGDCSKQSNCLSIIPFETEFGRKRKIDQSSCNKDYSCVKGFCPSFVSIEGGELRKPELRRIDGALETLLANLPAPSIPEIDRAYDLLVAGVGGTGVVTIGAILTMAAHLEGKGATVLDFMGFAQKGGSVLSYVRLGRNPEALNQVRIDAGEAEAVIACDLVVATDPRSLSVMAPAHTRVVANADIAPTADFIRDRNIDFDARGRLRTLRTACSEDRVVTIDATEIALRLLGDTVFSNMFLLGFAWQQGLAPVGLAALMRAIELNGVAVEKNKTAFNLGRAAAIDASAVTRSAGLSADPPAEPPVEELVQRRAAFLTDYQDADYAERYRAFADKVQSAAGRVKGGENFARAVAKNLFKLMAYKDEYEVARLYTDGSFLEKVAAEFAGNYRIRFHMAPPIFNRGLDDQGRSKKSTFGPWMYGALSVLRRLKFLRGGPLDPFGRSEERRLERKLIDDYRETVADVARRLSNANLEAAIAIANIPDEIRGYGPVKLASIRKADEKLAALLEKFHQSAAATAAA